MIHTSETKTSHFIRTGTDLGDADIHIDHGPNGVGLEVSQHAGQGDDDPFACFVIRTRQQALEIIAAIATLSIDLPEVDPRDADEPDPAELAAEHAAILGTALDLPFTGSTAPEVVHLADVDPDHLLTLAGA